MSMVLVVGVVWLALALAVGLLLAGAIRVADGAQPVRRTERNVAVDGDPFPAPLPAALVFETAGAPPRPIAPRAGHPYDQN